MDRGGWEPRRRVNLIEGKSRKGCWEQGWTNKIDTPKFEHWPWPPGGGIKSGKAQQGGVVPEEEHFRKTKNWATGDNERVCNTQRGRRLMGKPRGGARKRNGIDRGVTQLP